MCKCKNYIFSNLYIDLNITSFLFKVPILKVRTKILNPNIFNNNIMQKI